MPDNNTIGVPLGTRLQRIVREPRYQYHDTDQGGAWHVWIATADYKHGTYLLLCDDGSAARVTVREDEGDEFKSIKPKDK